MKPKATHTWNIYLTYYSCLCCGKIIEDRQPFITEKNLEIKNIFCEGCGNTFTISRQKKSKWLPLFGSSSKHEINWEQHR